MDVPTDWQALTPEADEALTKVATLARDQVLATKHDVESVRSALADFLEGWKSVGSLFPGVEDTDVRECIADFFDELVRESGADLDPEVLWEECAFGLVGTPDPPTLTDALGANDPPWALGLATALRNGLMASIQDDVGRIHLPAIGALQVRYRPGRPGMPMPRRPVDRLQAAAAGAQLAIPSRTWITWRTHPDVLTVLQDPGAWTPKGTGPLAETFAEVLGSMDAAEAYTTTLRALAATLGEDRAMVEVGRAWVFRRVDRPTVTGRNPDAGETFTIPSRTQLQLHVRRKTRDLITVAFERPS
ncbi:MAG: hypothetical protein AAGA48_08320 [Myxococcota bacterium]